MTLDQYMKQAGERIHSWLPEYREEAECLLCREAAGFGGQYWQADNGEALCTSCAETAWEAVNGNPPSGFDVFDIARDRSRQAKRTQALEAQNFSFIPSEGDFRKLLTVNN